MTDGSFLPLATVYEEGLEGARGLLAVEPPSLGPQRKDEYGGESAPEDLEMAGSLELPLG